ncbi:thioredoxin [Oceanibaculum pacificum]|uniref:Thioredoxin n=1 Tax=Oceanibaculum pacificum TaxID=580166 RepID=A0A154WH83_9PROT|nr:thioredoxin [Oceanibaculum pacificum]KZD12870.1 co-chaperone YbbN [Oceanibaculum pacificum]
MDILIGGNKSGAPAGGPGGNPYVKDSSTASFMADVIEPSRQQPVIVDFWAPWCGPCKQLGPALEKAVAEAKGAVRMVKINVDENPELSAQLRIQSIPTVYAFFQGQPIDAFQGALPESQVKAFVARLIEAAGGGADDGLAEALEQAKLLMEQGEAGQAAALYSRILQHDPENAGAAAGLIRALIAAGRVDQAKAMLAQLPPELAKTPEVTGAAQALSLAEEAAAAAGELASLQGKLAANPDDHEARLQLALALYATGDMEGAADALLESIRRNRTWNEEAARKQLLKFFEAWGPTDPVTALSRRRLSSILFA